MRTRRTFKPEFKAKVVIECINSEKSVSEVCREYQRLRQVIKNVTVEWPNLWFPQDHCAVKSAGLAGEPQARVPSNASNGYPENEKSTQKGCNQLPRNPCPRSPTCCRI